jgi:ATP-dependent DNA helicase Rep
VTSPKRGIGHQTLAALGAFAGRWKSSLFEALFAETLADALPRARDRRPARVRPRVNALQERRARRPAAKRPRRCCSAG